MLESVPPPVPVHFRKDDFKRRGLAAALKLLLQNCIDQLDRWKSFLVLFLCYKRQTLTKSVGAN